MPTLAAVGLLAVSCHLLRSQDILLAHVTLQASAFRPSVLIAIRSCEVEPHVGQPLACPPATLAVRHAETVLTAGVALLGGEAIPLQGFEVIFRHALAPGIHSPEIVLSTSMALPGSEAIPLDGFGVALPHVVAARIVAALVIHCPKIVLSTSVALFSGQPKPLGGFDAVPWDAQRSGIQEAEIDLGLGVALLGGKAIPLGGFKVVLRLVFANSVPLAQLK